MFVLLEKVLRLVLKLHILAFFKYTHVCKVHTFANMKVFVRDVRAVTNDCLVRVSWAVCGHVRARGIQ